MLSTCLALQFLYCHLTILHHKGVYQAFQLVQPVLHLLFLCLLLLLLVDGLFVQLE